AWHRSGSARAATGSRRTSPPGRRRHPPEVRRPRPAAGGLGYRGRAPGQGATVPAPGGGAAAPASTWRRATPRDAYICRACGYTETYPLDLDGIPVDGDLVAPLSGEKDGPYR